MIDLSEDAAAKRIHAARTLRRRIPQWVKDKVWKRDGGCCNFVASDGLRCSSRDFLEFDHIIPWALGGPSNDPGNIRLLCRTHNQHFARVYFGDFRQSRPNDQGRSGRL